MSKKLILTPSAYKAGKVYAVKPINGTGDFDFVRNTGRTRVNVNGNIEELSNNIVALDYQNGCPEILLEPQRTNLIEYSEDFSDSYWSKTNLNVTTNAEVSPTGVSTADKLIPTIDNNLHRIIFGGFFGNAGNIYVTSLFIKAKEFSKIRIILDAAANKNIDYDVNTDTFSGIGDDFISANSINYGNGWYRIAVKSPVDFGGSFFQINILNNSGDRNYASDGISGLFIWGVQLEEGELTSYIPTNGSQVTRNKDILQKDLTPIIQPTYTAFLEVVGDEGRLKIEDNDTGIDLPLNGSGKIGIQVDNQIKIIFPDNGQPETELIYDKPNDLRNIDIVSKLADTRIGVIAIEDGVQDVSNWISGNVSSYFIETDWSAETNLNGEFKKEDYDYFPAIDLSSGTNFQTAWFQNNLTSFPAIDLISGTNFFYAFRENNLTSFPAIDLSNGTTFGFAWRFNNLTSFPANMFDTNTASNYDRAFENNDLDQQSVDNILISVNTSAQANNITNGDLGISSGTNATPSQAGKDAADALRNAGWTVTLNGY